MITAVQAFLDAHTAGAKGAADDWLRTLPGWQVAIRFEDFAPACPDRIEPALLRRPANALNIEIGAPMPRCRLNTPEGWDGADHRAARWLASGGSALVLGVCACATCPRAASKGRAA